MNILGISALYHDSAAALCVDGEIIAAAQEERFTRIKHDSGFPVNAIDYCLSLLPEKKPDYIVFYDNPLLTTDRWISNIAELGEDSKTLIDRSFDPMFKLRFWINKLIENHFRDTPPPPKKANCWLQNITYHTRLPLSIPRRLKARLFSL